MSTKWKKAVVISSLSFSLMIAGCAIEKSNDAETSMGNEMKTSSQHEKGTASSSFDITSSPIGEQLNAYHKITNELNHINENKEVNWNRVQSLYEDRLQPVVTEMNVAYDKAITLAMEAGSEGNLDENAAGGLIVTVTQSYFYQKQHNMHSNIKTLLDKNNTTQASQQLEQLKHLADRVFIPIAEKQDEYYGLNGDSSIVQKIKSGLAAQKRNVENANSEEFSINKQITHHSVYRSYYLTVLSTVGKIEQEVSSETGTEEELVALQAKAWGLYQAIKGSISTVDGNAADEINTLLSLNKTDVSSIDAGKVRHLFVQGLVGRVQSFHSEAAESVASGNISSARAQAMEANMITKTIELAMKDKLGEEATSTALKKTERWMEWITDGEAEKASKISKEIITTLNQIGV
ncbi:hypothetical protein ACFFGV_02210 [Pontibacillus salicampi]|uniref:Lipoprotein n=1 Tax=Pontibacillus salicampi TaxID=1449801 RepID=A0ABV6LJC5_9BACI